MYVCGYVHVSAVAQRGQKRASDPQKLELQGVVITWSGCWEPNWSPPQQEQFLLRTAVPSLWPPLIKTLCEIFMSFPAILLIHSHFSLYLGRAYLGQTLSSCACACMRFSFNFERLCTTSWPWIHDNPARASEDAGIADMSHIPSSTPSSSPSY